MQKPNKKHENLGGATKPVQKSFGWQLILAHTHEELKLNWGGRGGGTPFPKCIEHRPSPLEEFAQLWSFGLRILEVGCNFLQIESLGWEISKAFFWTLG
jgi:hypothetical protein